MAARRGPLACLMVLLCAAADARAEDGSTPPPAVALPATIELGAVPRARAGRLTGRVELTVARREAGTRLELRCDDPALSLRSPRPVLRAGRNAFNFRLETGDTAPGPRTCTLRAFLARDDGTAPVALGRIPVRWRVYESAVTVRNWQPPGPLHAASRGARARVEIRATPDLAGRRLALRCAFDDLPDGMRVTVGPAHVHLRGGSQVFDVALRFAGLRRGRFEGRLRLEPEDGAHVADPLPLVLDVGAAAVRAQLLGDGGDLAAEPERFLQLELSGCALDGPAVVELAVDRGGLPPGVTVHAPARVRVEPGAGSTLVPIRLTADGGLPSGAWRPALRLVSRTPDVVAAPAFVPVPVRARSLLERHGRAIPLAGAGLLAAFLLLRVTLRRGGPEPGLEPAPDGGIPFAGVGAGA